MRIEKVLQTNAPASILMIRIMVGAVFFCEGIQKFLYAAELGSGRFIRIGIPVPEIMGPFVGTIEIVCGMLVILGFFVRPAAFLLLINITVAILSTKIPILLGHGYWTFTLQKLARYGFWSMVHEARTDFCMALGSLYLIVEGAGIWSFDAKWVSKNEG